MDNDGLIPIESESCSQRSRLFFGIRLGFDIGGTFTDLIAIDEATGESSVVKCPTTPSDPAQGVVNGLEILFGKIGISGSSLTMGVHSTTLVTNTVIERKGARQRSLPQKDSKTS
jgi:N-methylhydantoinase A/oxoprolinase/acetone carboxylase beta subunit